MREMKDSGLQWISTIPKSWEVNRIKHLFGTAKGLPITKENLIEEGLPVISYGQIHSRTNTGVDISQGLLRYVAYDYRKNSLSKIEKYDFVFADTSEDYEGCGNCAYKRTDSELYGGYHVVILKSVKKKDNRYFAYLFQTDAWRNQIREKISGVKVFSITQKIIKDSSVIIPPTDEQQRIADFLDAKCAEINALTVNIQVQIDTLEQYKRSVITETVTTGINPDLEMKASGIEWVGNIPSSWSVLKGKYMFAQRSLRGNSIELQLLSPTQKFGVIPQTRYEELSGMSAVKLNEKADLSLLKTIHKGDFCISLRSFQGGFEYSEYEGVVSPAYQVFYPTVEIADSYYKYLFKEQGFIEKMNSYTMTLRDGKNIAFSDFGNTYIPYPPLAEQFEIAAYLNRKCAQIDALITEKQQQLATLDEYKKSLIFEYVTGKKEVPPPDSDTVVALDPHIILLGIINDRIGKKRARGKVQLQKLLYLVDYYVGINSNTQYYRYEHGPYDRKLDNYIEVLVKNGWYQRLSDNNGILAKGKNHDEFVKKYKNNFRSKQSEISRLVDALKDMKTSQLERIATLFAVWNDFILEGQLHPTDKTIINEVVTNWTQNKANPKYSTWEMSLEKMKKLGIVPTGQGLHTIPKP